ncbi:MAG TPA: aminofutalosine synthase MqnE [Bacteroidetes bacterium]|nr:aminofutalosine synthase MqnE [Bacteroidota bacterium]
MKDFIPREFRTIYGKIINDERITSTEGLMLYNSNNPGLLGYLADIVRKRKNDDHAFFNRNFHVEPTNICIHNCEFCSYRKAAGSKEAWNYSAGEILDIVRRFDDKPVTEVHIVGGVHPDHNIDYYCRILQMIKNHRPGLHIKAFSAIELDYIINKSGLSIREGLLKLKECGLNSIPGGGAEIFDEKVRAIICKDKSSSAMWLKIHEEAHMAGIPSNATILYGHMETYEHRIDHMERLRKLQDRTAGFNSFIPLKFRKENNKMRRFGEVNIIEDMKNYAVSRIFLDNFPHIKAYWPALGKETTQLALSFGVDDVDGTIDDTTKIYSMAGAKDQNPSMTTEDICQLIRGAGFKPVERDTLYKVVKEW